MRLAVASDNESDIAAHTGRCRGFVIYDVIEGEPKRVEYRPNDSTAHARGECSGESHQHGHAGHHSHGSLLEALSDCQALVTRGMGPRLVVDLNSQGIAPHVCDVEDVDQAARLFAKGQLTRVEGGGACHRR
jgi:predicted Fe-Mo cluster-binding NifX family protein